MLTHRLRLAARIKKTPRSNQIKFKVRCQRYLYTLVLKDSDKADKLKQSLPPGMSPPVSHQASAASLIRAILPSGLSITDTPKSNAKGKRVAK